MECPQCAHENPVDAQYCNHCGGPLGLWCPGCGKANPPQSRFCNGCGRALAAEAPPPARIQPTQQPGAAAPPSPGGPKTILVVEDRADVRQLARDILEDKGYHVLEAEDPQEALRIVEQPGASIDLLLTDLVMPQMSGLELAKRLQALRPHMHVLYMSGFVSSGVPAGELVQKPFKAEALTQKVQEVLDVSPTRPRSR